MKTSCSLYESFLFTFPRVIYDFSLIDEMCIFDEAAMRKITMIFDVNQRVKCEAARSQTTK